MSYEILKQDLQPIDVYKEPLKKVELGSGYYGVLMGTEDGALIQCHECGNLYSNLAMHVRGAHKMKSSEYKDKYQLARSKGLVSSVERDRMVEHMLQRIKEEGWDTSDMRAFGRKGFNARKKVQPKLSLEAQNKRGTCPTQLLEKIKEVKKKIGHVPTLNEFEKALGTQKYKHVIYRIFGSYNNALKMLKFRTTSAPARYTDEELLAYITNFEEKHRRLPSRSDFEAGSLPDRQAYRRHFGSWSKAKGLVN